MKLPFDRLTKVPIRPGKGSLDGGVGATRYDSAFLTRSAYSGLPVMSLRRTHSRTSVPHSAMLLVVASLWRGSGLRKRVGLGMPVGVSKANFKLSARLTACSRTLSMSDWSSTSSLYVSTVSRSWAVQLSTYAILNPPQ